MPPTSDPDDRSAVASFDKNSNQSVERALTILELVAESEEIGVREIARKLGLATSIAQRLVSTLADASFLNQSPESHKYRIGHRAYAVGQAYSVSNSLMRSALPLMREISTRLEASVFLGALQGRSVVYLADMQVAGPILLRNAPGTIAPLHTTSFGKALLFDMSDEQVVALLGPEPYEKLTNATIVRQADFLADLEKSRRLGYAVSINENIEGVSAAAVPIYDQSRRIVASLSVSTISHTMKPKRLALISDILKETSALISRGIF